MIKRNIIRNLMLLQKAREQAMEKRLQEIMPKVEMDIANTDPKDIPEDFEEMDPKLYGILKKHAYKEPPEHLKEKVLEAVFQKQKSKQKDLKLFILASMQTQLKLQYVAAILILVVVSSTAYYLYGTTSYINPDLTSKKQAPIINVDPSPKPVFSPEVTPFTTPNIAKGNGNDKLNINIKNQNDKKFAIAIANDQMHKSNKNNRNLDKNSINNIILPKTNKTNDNEEIADNININKTAPSIKDASNGDTLRAIIVDTDLSEINDFYIASFGNEEENKELREALTKIFKNTDLSLLTTTESLFNNHFGEVNKKGDFINIIDSNNNKLLWQISIKGMTGSPKEISENIVNELLKDIKSQKEK